MTANNSIQVNKKWTIIEMSVKDYAEITGHSEGYVRQSFLQHNGQEGDGRIRIRIGTRDMMEEIHDVKGIREDEGGRCA